MPASRKIQICHISLLKRNEANYRCHLQYKSHWLTGDMSPKPLILDANISQCTFSWKTFRDSLSYHFPGQLITNNPSAASTMTGCNPHNTSERHLLMVSKRGKRGSEVPTNACALCFFERKYVDATFFQNIPVQAPNSSYHLPCPELCTTTP